MYARSGMPVALVGFNLEHGIVEMAGGAPLDVGSQNALAAGLIGAKEHAKNALARHAAREPLKLQEARDELAQVYSECPADRLRATLSFSSLLFFFLHPAGAFFDGGGSKTRQRIEEKQRPFDYHPTAEVTVAVNKKARDVNTKELVACVDWLRAVGCQGLSQHLLEFGRD
jgi:hypothetical protein